MSICRRKPDMWKLTTHCSVTEIVDMPDGTVDLLFRFLRQNTGVLSKRGRENEFAKLTDDEIAKVEASYRNAFPK